MTGKRLKDYSPWIAIGVLAILGVFLFSDLKRPVREPGENPKISDIVGITPSDVSRVEIDSSATKIAISRSGSRWSIEQPMRTSADPDAVKKILDGLLDRATDYIADAPKDLARYGLDKPQVTVTLRGLRGDKRVLLGQKDASKNSLYALDPEARKIFLVSSSDADSVLGKSAADFRDKTILAIPEDRIQSISIHKNQSTVVLNRSADGKWELNSPWKTPADSSAAGDVVRVFEKLKAERFVEPREKADAALALLMPVLSLTAKDKDGKEHELKIGHKVAVKPESYAVLTERSQEPVLLSDSTIRSLDKGASDLRSRQILEFDTAKVLRLEVTAPKGKWAVEKKGDDWLFAAPDKGGKAKKDVIDSLLADIASPASRHVTETPQNLARYGLDKPSITAIIEIQGGGRKSYFIGKKTGVNYFTRSSDSPAIFQVSSFVHDNLDKSAAAVK